MKFYITKDEAVVFRDKVVDLVFEHLDDESKGLWITTTNVRCDVIKGLPGIVEGLLKFADGEE